MTVNEFYESFLCDAAPFGQDAFFTKLGNRDVSIDPTWSSNNSKLLKAVIKISGVPFVSQSRHEKLITIVEKSDTKLIVKMDNRTL